MTKNEHKLKEYQGRCNRLSDVAKFAEEMMNNPQFNWDREAGAALLVATEQIIARYCERMAQLGGDRDG